MRRGTFSACVRAATVRTWEEGRRGAEEEGSREGGEQSRRGGGKEGMRGGEEEGRGEEDRVVAADACANLLAAACPYYSFKRDLIQCQKSPNTA